MLSFNDVSGMTQWPGGTKQQAAIAEQFLRTVASGQDLGGIVNFNIETFIDAQNEADPVALASKLQRTGGGGTALYDAVISAARYLEKQPSHSGYRKLIFAFCDGHDNASKTSLDYAVKDLQKTQIPIFVFAPSTVETTQEGRNLRQLSSGVGGRVYFFSPPSVSFDQVKQDLAESFLLTLAIGPGNKSLPLVVSDIVNPNRSVVAPTKIYVSR